MTFLKSFRGLRGRIRIELTQWGYDVQVYGQTVMRADTYRKATRMAASLRRALAKKNNPAATR